MTAFSFYIILVSSIRDPKIDFMFKSASSWDLKIEIFVICCPDFETPQGVRGKNLSSLDKEQSHLFLQAF